MAAELRLVRPDGGPMDLADEEIQRFSALGLEIFFERVEHPLPRAIRVDAGDGFEETGRETAAHMAEAFELTAIDLSAGALLTPDRQAPWWAYWRGR